MVGTVRSHTNSRTRACVQCVVSPRSDVVRGRRSIESAQRVALLRGRTASGKLVSARRRHAALGSITANREETERRRRAVPWRTRETEELYCLPRRPPPFVPLAAGCCWLFVPVRHGLMNFFAPNSACARYDLTCESASCRCLASSDAAAATAAAAAAAADAPVAAVASVVVFQPRLTIW